MAVTAIRSEAQIEYRLIEGDGCDREHQKAPGPGERHPDHGASAAVEYRLDGKARPLEWIGAGLAEVGLVAGERVDPHAARALMSGQHPATREQLTNPVWRVADAGKLSAAPLLAALRDAADRAGAASPAALMPTRDLRERLARLERMNLRDGGEHRAPVTALAQLATAAGIELESVYRPAALASAWRHAGDRERVDVAGDDIGFTLPKSVSTAWGLAPADVRGIIEEEFLASVRSAVSALETWCSYGVSGHQGDGEIAERVASSGFLGWIMTHKSARPVAGSVGDPHLHAHVVLARMVRCEDGKWRSPASGGRDLRRHSHAANELQKALFRTALTERLGVAWEYNEANREWEIAAVPTELRGSFSRRNRQILEAGGAELSTAQRRVLAAKQREAKQDIAEVDVLTAWHANAVQVLADRHGQGGEERLRQVLAAAFPGAAGPGEGLDLPDLAGLASQVFDPETGVTSKRKDLSRAQALAEVARALPPGLYGHLELETLTDQVLAEAGYAVALADLHASHHTNAARYTTVDVLAAEQVITTVPAERIADHAAIVDPVEAVRETAVFEAAKQLQLSGEQRAAVLRLLTAGHGVDTVQGLAGAGKTTMLSAARHTWEQAGLTVAGAAMMAVAAQNLQAESGITSTTVASWLLRIQDGEGLAGIDVLVVDEAAMADDRTLAKLLAHTAETGTKLVLVGDEQQLQPIGVGGGFAEIHRTVQGLALKENRRQRAAVERDALTVWRTGGRSTALARLADAGHVHATEIGEQTTAAMLTVWSSERHRWSDPHENLRNLLLLAGRNADVDALNAGARQIRRAAGELGADHAFALADGRVLDLAVGDLVRTKVNDRRSRRTAGSEPDILNGYRGVVLTVDQRGALVQWQRGAGPDKLVTEQAWLTRDQIAEGALTHAYAMTVTAAQGLTAMRALVNGTGADAFTLYPAITRAKERSDLWLPLQSVEDEGTRARLGAPASPGQLLLRAVSAYGKTLDADSAEGMITGRVAERGPVGPNTPNGGDGPGPSGPGRPRRTPRGPEPHGPGGGGGLALRTAEPAVLLVTVEPAAPLSGLENGPVLAQPQASLRRPEAAAVLEPWRTRTAGPEAGEPAGRQDIDILVEDARDRISADRHRPEELADERGRQARSRRTTATTRTHRATARAAADQVERDEQQPHRSGHLGRLARAAEQRAARHHEAAPAADRIRTTWQQATATALVERPAPAAPTIDPAVLAAVAEQARALAAQQEASRKAEAEQRVARLAADAAIPSWRQREFGHVIDIKRAHDSALEKAAAADKLAAAAQRTVDELGPVLGTDRAPAAARVAELVGYLHQSQEQLQLADELTRQADENHTRVLALWEEQRREYRIQELVQQKAAKRFTKLTFRAAGMHEVADALGERLTERRALIDQLDRQRNELLNAARDAEREAWKLRGRSQIQRDEAPEDHLARITRHAHRADTNAYQRALSEAERHRTSAADHRARAEGLVEEARLRKQMSPERNTAENTRRREHRARIQEQRRQEQQRLQEQYRQQQHYRGPEPPSHRGPSRGR
ncbi:MobF family relaxase [Kitasatospora cathayae]|uniref:Relaxase domain-containing protein n=1 Tax=Kitasatospora cathayae TaxID=3004092 RepID=A0ABY7QII8_9ACTN|nr:MobF family relaxase [Kitasatospora sp. HUAS 3-15]WBP92172.1 relaxase domain-containing protein [Kitasatospora sp. HUAS 3-15]